MGKQVISGSDPRWQVWEAGQGKQGRGKSPYEREIWSRSQLRTEVQVGFTPAGSSKEPRQCIQGGGEGTACLRCLICCEFMWPANSLTLRLMSESPEGSCRQQPSPGAEKRGAGELLSAHIGGSSSLQHRLEQEVGRKGGLGHSRFGIPSIPVDFRDQREATPSDFTSRTRPRKTRGLPLPGKV